MMPVNRHFRAVLVIALLVLALGACTSEPPPAATSTTAAPTDLATLPAPGISVEEPPDPEGTAAAFLQAWEDGDYTGMYSLLSPLSQDAIALADFERFYTNQTLEATITSVETRIRQALQTETTAEVQYDITLNTRLVGPIERETTMQLTFMQGRWGVNWARSLFLPELGNDNGFFMAHKIPGRGNIYDRNGLALAAQGDAVAIGLVPGELNYDREDDLLYQVSLLIDRHPETIRTWYQFAQPDWYVPLGIASADAVAERYNILSTFPGLRLSTFQTRFYNDAYFGAPHAIGYTAYIPESQLNAYRAAGYRGDERVGVLGVELWGEAYLSGKRGGTLHVVSPAGEILHTLGDGASAPASNITTTIDRAFQHEVQAALQNMPGAIVVMNYNTGEILATASGPSFDPNLFEPSNPNAGQLNEVLANPFSPLVNRATQGQYPPGSTFKVVTAAAAVEAGLFDNNQIYYCGYSWDELGPNFIKYDWTYEREDFPPSGDLNLVGALRRSCNPWFYHIGLNLFNWDPFYLPEYTKSFGFGQPTGVIGLLDGTNEEAPGVVPDEAWVAANTGQWQAGNNVNMAIGQGELLVTPLQLATAYSAIANGGTVYRPSLILEVAGLDEDPVYSFTPEVTGQVELSEATLDVLYTGMWEVVNDELGTAREAMIGLDIPAYGKTGTAETTLEKPHAWFAGFTRAELPDKPDIAIVVLVENRGDGSEWAAPIFRRIVEVYFYGQINTLYPWEAEIGLTATPEPTEDPFAPADGN